MPSESKTGHVRKRCDCAKWKECTHAWYVDCQDGKRRYRPNLDRLIGRHAVDFAEAKREAERAIEAWKDGRCAADLLPSDRPTLAKLLTASANVLAHRRPRSTRRGRSCAPSCMAAPSGNGGPMKSHAR
jgi:hypothetical protein